MRTTNSSVILGTFLSLFATVTNAQDTSDGWSGQATIYGWMPGIQGAEERQDGSPVVDLGQSSILDSLQGAFFGTIEARKGKTGYSLDLAYANLGHDGSAKGSFIPGSDPANANIGMKFLMGTGVVSHRFYEDGKVWIDGYGGVRYFDVKTDFTLKVPSVGFKTKKSAGASWFDAVVGVRAHTSLGDRFGLTGLADIGGFGIGGSSNLSWQLIGTLDYSFSENVIGRLGYSYLSIDKSSSDLSLDIDMFGPMIGLTFKF